MTPRYQPVDRAASAVSPGTTRGLTPRTRPLPTPVGEDREPIGPSGAAGGASNLHTPEGGVSLTFQYYSPSGQQLLNFTPGGMGGGMFPSDGVLRDPARALPADFVDLPQAVAAARGYGMQGVLVERAQLENWAPGTSYGSARLGGLQWMIDSAIDERYVVPARLP